MSRVEGGEQASGGPGEGQRKARPRSKKYATRQRWQGLCWVGSDWGQCWVGSHGGQCWVRAPASRRRGKEEEAVGEVVVVVDHVRDEGVLFAPPVGHLRAVRQPRAKRQAHVHAAAAEGMRTPRLMTSAHMVLGVRSSLQIGRKAGRCSNVCGATWPIYCRQRFGSAAAHTGRRSPRRLRQRRTRRRRGRTRRGRGTAIRWVWQWVRLPEEARSVGAAP